MRVLSRLFRSRPALLRLVLGVTVSTVALAAGGPVEPQRRGGGGQRGRVQQFVRPWMYDGAFVFCRLAFREAPDGDGGGWQVDYPKADMNFPWRLGQLTTTPISRDSRGEANHVVVTAMDPHLFECPFVMMT